MRLQLRRFHDKRDSVSIHAPVRGATSQNISSIVMLSGFNPRTREGCDAVITVPITVAIPVSIHAPVRGATSITNFFRELIHVSIHAPVRGATCITLYNHTTNMIVSIHAPVRGATANNIPLFTISASFNPRTREGCD